VIPFRYIGIEGAIGVGKTSLAHLLSEHLGGRLILEKHEENPFLPDFYRDPQRYAFQTQLFFLLSRYRQQVDIRQEDLFQTRVISDYIFAKDRIFARLNLDDREFWLYEKVASLLERDVPRPDLVIYLQSSIERLMANIRKRGRPYEKEISEDYIRALVDAYNQFFLSYRDSPLLVVDTRYIDFVHNEQDLKKILNQIRHPFQGTRYYSPGLG